MHPIQQHRSTTVQSTSNGSIRFRFMEEEEPATASIPSPKTSSMLSPLKRRDRRAEQKRVVSVPGADVNRSLAKGEGAPPSDSWAWRKYGQKPIKGSPYPRGYYRCSTSKGCPAKKQVERSSGDPTVLVITYAGEHNHPSPAFRSSTSSRAPANNLSPEIGPAVLSGSSEIEPEVKFADVGSEASVLLPDDLSWLSDMASSPSSEARLENPVLAGSCDAGADMEALLRPMREEEESMFANLGELPECSMVFRRGFCESRRCTLASAPWCGSTG